MTSDVAKDDSLVSCVGNERDGYRVQAIVEEVIGEAARFNISCRYFRGFAFVGHRYDSPVGAQSTLIELQVKWSGQIIERLLAQVDIKSNAHFPPRWIAHTA